MASSKKTSSSSTSTAEANDPRTLSGLVTFINNNFTMLLLLGLAFFAGFFVGSLWTERHYLKQGVAPTAQVGGTDTVAGATPNPTPAPVDNMPELSGDDHVRGNINQAKVVLVEYSDFECPFCARFHPTMEQIVEEFGNDVAWVYRHYPLSFHPNAKPSAEASECIASLVGEDAFWQFGDALIDVTNADGRLSEDAIQEAAQATGVNMTAFNTCLDSGEMSDIVDTMMQGGSSAGVTGTPGTIIVTDDGPQELIPGALPYSSVKATVEKYL